MLNAFVYFEFLNIGIPNSTYSLLRLRNDRQLCLRSGIDHTVAKYWYESTRVFVVGVVSVAIYFATFAYEHMRGKKNTISEERASIAYMEKHL